MFRELSPLLTKRSLVLTLASVGDDRVRVTITPRPAGKEDAKELAQPFAVEGTAAELNAELSQLLVSYTAELLTLARSLEQVRANMEAALKEAKDEAAKKIGEAKKGSKQSLTRPAPAETKAEVKKPATPSLFDAPSETVPASPTIAAVGTAAASSVEETDGPENDESDEDEASKPLSAPSSQAIPKGAAQPSIFNTSNEEDEILQEAFYGAEDSHIAA